ncbi:MAG TPA: hypothetical protein DD781_01775 [Leclercia adecarboxylata]|nr:hypothetical protein C3F35_03135 [Leclercia sp. LSNIH3]POW70457.1 hypothetical protein C3373_14555 [Leclercia sp. LSNIH4]HBQ65548.1 hypothetical protein [Leclercia adecarboxylata]HCQ08686.1 hypothetical protein [Leclercia adecarboxylata]
MFAILIVICPSCFTLHVRWLRTVTPVTHLYKRLRIHVLATFLRREVFRGNPQRYQRKSRILARKKPGMPGLDYEGKGSPSPSWRGRKHIIPPVTSLAARCGTAHPLPQSVSASRQTALYPAG